MSRALEALAKGGLISVQVLNDFASVARKKHERPWADIEAALGAGCDALVIEDMQHGRLIGELTIVNPFSGFL